MRYLCSKGTLVIFPHYYGSINLPLVAVEAAKTVLDKL